jgi:hypothetical protein
MSGRRLVLTYNLVHTTQESKELVANLSKEAKLRDLLSWWMEKVDVAEMPKSLAFLLEHKYSDASLRYANLKGCDHQVASHLRKICDETGFYFYLASFHRQVFGGCDDNGPFEKKRVRFHELIEEIDRETYLTRIVDLEGTEIDFNLQIDDEILIQENPFDKVDPDDEEYSGYTGNEGVSATHFYRRTVRTPMKVSTRKLTQDIRWQ